MQLEQQLQIKTPTPLQRLDLGSQAEVWCKRDDLLHPYISGNKWRKLSPVIKQALRLQYKHIGSFGGAYSNHLHALGYVCYQLAITFTAIVRAHPNSSSTPMLDDLHRWGHDITFLSREEYKLRTDKHYTDRLCKSLGLDLLIPEGGSDGESLQGVASIIEEVCQQHQSFFDLIVLPVASGGTMAGLVKYLAENAFKTQVLGVAVLRGEGYLEQTVSDLLAQSGCEFDRAMHNWRILHDQAFHCGGYAKVSGALTEFQRSFFCEHNIALDKVYNAKSFFALKQLLSQNKLSKFHNIMILHTGGLQGEREKNV